MEGGIGQNSANNIRNKNGLRPDSSDDVKNEPHNPSLRFSNLLQ
jgi:hypothetical protein